MSSTKTLKVVGLGTYWNKGPQPVPDRLPHLLGSSLQGKWDVWVTAAWLPVWLCQKSSDTLPLFGPQFSHLQSRARRRALNSFGILGLSRNLMKSEDPLPRNSSPPVSLPGGHCIPTRLHSHHLIGWVCSADITNALYNSRAYTHDPAGTPK